MKKVLVFSGSNSSKSINQQLARYAGGLLEEAQAYVIDLRNFPAPIYSSDMEATDGIPESIQELLKIIESHDAVIFSAPEHNGYIPAVAKNTFDWLSRAKNKFFGERPMLLLSTSPGAKGGANTLKILSGLIPWWGANVIGQFSLGKFHEHMVDERLSDSERTKLQAQVKKLEDALVAETA